MNLKSILVVMMVLVANVALAMPTAPESGQRVRPQTGEMRNAIGAARTVDEGACDEGRPVVLQHAGPSTDEGAGRAVCPNF